MIITFLNRKGGTGKTTVGLLLGAVLLREAGRAVYLRDLDDQRSASWFIENHEDYARLGQTEAPTYTLIDTPGILHGAGVTNAILDANGIVIVTTPSPADLDATTQTVAKLRELGALEKARLLFNRVDNRTKLSRGLGDFAEATGVPALTNSMTYRACYQQATFEGWKALTPDAREELLKLALEIVSM
jgi:chromosome partitioning protein